MFEYDNNTFVRQVIRVINFHTELLNIPPSSTWLIWVILKNVIGKVYGDMYFWFWWKKQKQTLIKNFYLQYCVKVNLVVAVPIKRQYFLQTTKEKFIEAMQSEAFYPSTILQIINVIKYKQIP